IRVNPFSFFVNFIIKNPPGFLFLSGPIHHLHSQGLYQLPPETDVAVNIEFNPMSSHSQSSRLTESVNITPH
ncbi:MAG: hypothetical protein ABI718_15915, partial [Acidobacteriota bacterium]